MISAQIDLHIAALQTSNNKTKEDKKMESNQESQQTQIQQQTLKKTQVNDNQKKKGNIHWRYLVASGFSQRILNAKFLDSLRMYTSNPNTKTSPEFGLKLLPTVPPRDTDNRHSDYIILHQPSPVINQTDAHFIYSAIGSINLLDNDYKETCQCVAVIDIVCKIPIFYEASTRGIYLTSKQLKSIEFELLNCSEQTLKRILQFCTYYKLGLVDKLLCITQCKSVRNNEAEQTPQTSPKSPKQFDPNSLDALAYFAGIEINNTYNPSESSKLGLLRKSTTTNHSNIRTTEVTNVKKADILNTFISALPQVLELYTNVIKPKKTLTEFYYGYIKQQKSCNDLESTKLINIIMMNRVLNRIKTFSSVKKMLAKHGMPFTDSFRTPTAEKKAEIFKTINDNILINMLYTEISERGQKSNSKRITDK